MKLGELNAEQQKAVSATPGPILIVAGPGTGKTKTLAARVAYLVDQGVPPDQLLALTFTKKSAHEMQSRVEALLPKGKSVPVITTFHGLCHQLLTAQRRQPPRLVDEAERQQIIRAIKKSHGLKSTSVRELSLRISQAKSSLHPESDRETAVLLQNYQDALREHEMSDFDDLLLETYHLLEADSAKHPMYQHILVDEFQDTNAIQYELLKLLNKTDSLFVIGDPLQSIYGFRGAIGEVFERFRMGWPEAASIRLATNYRSTPEVVHLSQAIFPDTMRLEAHRTDAGRVHVIQVLNEYSEAHWIIEAIEQTIGGSTMLRGHEHQGENGPVSFRDFAVLYRTHRTAKTLEKLLAESGLPYQVAGEGSPYNQPSVVAIIGELRKTRSDTTKTSQLIAQKARGLGFDISSPDIRAFVNAAVRFDDAGLTAYLDHLDAIAEQEFYDPSADAVTLLTIHAAKGLEFKQVFLIGAEEGILPHYPPKGEPNVDEERRLFYVAITRARDNLDILYTKKRAGNPATLSRFVKDIPEDILPRIPDPAMADQQRRLRKQALKRSQTTLF